jgi:serine/threonine protein kinase
MDHDTQARRLVAGRYRLMDALGHGGFGCVWRAHDELLDVTVAIKEVRLPRGLHARAEYLVRAEREARNTAKLRNAPHIVPVYDVVTEDSALWMVMRLIEGHSLEQRLMVSMLSVAEAWRVANHLLQALHAAHAAGIVHRDLKPANVLLEWGGEVWLTDFGIAVHHNDTALTATGLVVGSPEYVAPERADGGDAVPASDLFSLGVVLYRALEGSSPFLRESAPATLVAVMMHEPEPARHAGELTELITALLRKDPAQRPTAGAALTMLAAAAPPAAAASPAAAAPSAVAAPAGERYTPTLTSATAPLGSPPLSAADPTPRSADSSRLATSREAFRQPHSVKHRSRSVKRRRRSKVAVIGVAATVLAGIVVALAVSRLDPAGPAGPVNLALGKHVTASSNHGTDGWAKADVTNGDTTPSDGIADMGWASQEDPGAKATEWIQVNLGAEDPIDEVKLYPRNDAQEPGGCFPSDFTISVSTNGNAFTSVVSESDYPSPGIRPQVFKFASTTARYVRVTATMLNRDQYGDYYFELKQIEIFNT